MLNRLNIGPRLVALIAVQAMALCFVAAVAVTSLRSAGATTEKLNRVTIEQVSLNHMSEILRDEMYGSLNNLAMGQIGPDVAQANILAAKNVLMSDWDEYQTGKTPEEIDALRDTLAKHFNSVIMAMDDVANLLREYDSTRMMIYMSTQLNRNVMPFLSQLSDQIAEQQLQSEALFKESLHSNVWDVAWTVLAAVLGLGIAGTLGYFVYLSMRAPIQKLTSVVAEISEGDFYARAKLPGSDEFSRLGAAFDQLLDERVTTLVQAEEDNGKLNDSVIALLHAVSKLSQRDLTVKIPVTEDITGPVADALNQLTSETARVLIGVRRIAEQVAKASTMVRMQSDVVIAVASSEQAEVEQTAIALAQAAETLNHISELTRECNSAAEEAARTTDTALDTVNGTVSGMNSIRTTIHDTEKRIKRLGERSQEVGRAIGLINTIAERTHILALNASMHAASAGEAGRGFAVVADEVQRLAENARDATQQIASLVGNIQSDTAETIVTMNRAIEQVVAGSRMAEEAGEQMQQTRDSTKRLVESVKQIAQDAEYQTRLGSELQLHASSIQESTRKTRTQMEEQTQYSKRLVQFAKGLVAAVQVFTLPQLPKASGDTPVTTAEISDANARTQQNDLKQKVS